jgi:hypothetical protein
MRETDASFEKKLMNEVGLNGLLPLQLMTRIHP